MAEATCKTCPWWVPNEYQRAHEIATCRRRSPAVWPEGVHGGYAPDAPWFPVTNADDFCGEHPERRKP